MNSIGVCRQLARSGFLFFLVFMVAWLALAQEALCSTQTGSVTNGEYRYYDITLPASQTGMRLVLDSSSPTDFYLHAGFNHTAGTQIASSANKTLHTLLVAPAALTDGGQYHVRIRAASGALTTITYNFSDDLTYYRDLAWDPGATSAGTSIMPQPDTAGGDYLFRITSQASLNGAWRHALAVTGGEADLYLQQNTPPLAGGSFSSTRVGSDGFVLAGGQFSANQTWYLRVHATPGATWQLVSGDIFVHDLGTVAADASSSSPSVTIGPEGTYYFSTTVDAATPAWRLWLNGANLPMYVKKLTAPVSTSQSYHEQYEQGQMLLVPPYLTNASYFVGVTGAPGSDFALDSRMQQVLIPSALPAYSQGGGTVDFDFNLSGEGNGGGYGYRTYRIDVPIDQIAWQVIVTPASGNPELYVRKGEVPNRWTNSGLSEAPAGVGDSITLVPSPSGSPPPGTLTNGVWYVTVYGTGSFSYALTSGNPTVTGSTFINTSTPNPVPPGYPYPYNTVPITNDQTTRSGWRYYQVSNIDSQLGFLGWQLDLANQVAATEIAIRRNAVPSRWHYRSGGDAYHTAISEANQADVSSTLGFLQHPGHPADIWYIGVSTPNQALGAFQLTTREIPAPLQNFTEGSITISSQPATTWQWFKYTVPADSLGWDLRMKVSGGTPRMVVRRDQLPSGFGSSSAMTWRSDWPTGYQWEAGGEWTGRYRTAAAVNDTSKYMMVGMGNPLEPGTYYVGVSGSDTMSYTLESRGIGIGNDGGGTPWPLQVADIAAFSGSSVSGSGLQPREAAYYRVTVPAGTKSWSVKLDPTLGESLLALRQGRLPNITASAGTDSDHASYFNGNLRQKDGREYFYKYQPYSGATTITPGVYYLAVVSEGQNPVNYYTIGTGGVDYTLSSEGEVAVADKTATPLAVGTPVAWIGETQAYGAQKVYRFRVPAGLTSIEVRLKNRVGNPSMTLRQDAAGSGLIPNPVYATYRANEGGRGYIAYNDSLINLAQPVEGDYTLVVSNQSLWVAGIGTTYPDAGYDVEITAQGVVDLSFANSSLAVVSQEANTWRYFRMIVPADGTLLGWDFRMKVSGGTPRMVVRRDQLPSGFGSSSAMTWRSDWPTGYQWEAGGEWTGRYRTAAAVNDTSKYMMVGMGNPLEPGTYYVGVSGSDTMSYTLESRGIGIGNDGGGTPWPLQVADIAAFSGSSVSGSGLQPREAAYYRVTVPAGTKSWSVKLDPTLGESLLALRQGRLPNITASAGTDSDHASYFNGNLRQKDGREYFYKYQPYSGATTITPGVYYLAVVSEGQNPVNYYTIGTGGVDYTLSSEGEVVVADKTATPLAVGTPVAWIGETQAYGAQKVYRFRVPAGLTSIEVRLKNRVGNPSMTLRQDAAGSGLIPNPVYATYRANEGGRSYIAYNDSLINLAQPVEGDYTLVVSNQSLWVAGIGTTYPDAGYDVEITAQGVVDLSFANSSLAVVSQEANTWRYFRMIVPADGTLLGWDFRMKVSGGTPRMVVRRDQLPSGFGSSSAMTWRSDWPTGYQWEAGGEWTGRYRTAAAVNDTSKYMMVGIGNPLEPGTYYVGVSGSDTMSYALESRGIGIGNDGGGTPWPLQVADIAAFSGSSVSGSGLQPREAAYYRVTVPAGTKSWSVKLDPTLGESLLALRQGRLPNITASAGTDSDHASYFNGNLRQKDGREYFYKYQPYSGATTITPGVYYLAVVSEGQNPVNYYTIGTGGVDYTLSSEGEVVVADKTATPLAVGTPVAWSGETQAYGAQKVYRFRVPAGLTSIEVRLKNRVGNPTMTLRQDAAGSGLIPNPVYATYRANEGGRSYIAYNDSLINLAQPVEGDYTLVVSNQSLWVAGIGTTYPDAGYDVEVRTITPIPLAITGGAVASGSLVDQQVAYHQVEVPATVDGQPLLGWLLKMATSSGTASVRVRKGLVPGNDNTGSVVSANKAITIVPPVLTPGTWYVEVKATGITDYTLSSDIVSADPAKHRRTWAMPARVGSFTQAGLLAPYFGDSGVDDQGQPIINPDTQDQGTDLAKGEWHFYRITVPADNAALLRTIVEALSGKPELYLRAGNIPSIDHYANPINPTSGGIKVYDRSQSLTGTMYGNWVPLDGKVEMQLPPGDWWLGIRAVTTNIRYRLKTAAGDVRDAGGQRLDTAEYVQDLAQDGGSKTGQNLAAGDIRYYRVAVPQSSDVPSAGTPLAWSLTLNQQLGDVVVFIRDTIPPGQGTDGDAGTSATAQSGYFQDWYDDNSYLNPVPYGILDTPGTYTLNIPPVEPGKAYYLGVYAKTDATFDLSSSVGAERLALTAVIPFINGAASRTLAAGETALYRIDAPADGILWHQNAQHAAGIQLYLGQGTVPPKNSYAHWRSNGSANTVFNRALDAFPWQPGHSYYLLVENTTAGPLPFSFTMDGRTSLSNLGVTVAGAGSGAVTSSPNIISCGNGTCTTQVMPYTSATLYASAATGSSFAGWSGNCGGTGSCGVTMDTDKAVTATFTLNNYTVNTYRSGNGRITSTPPGIDCAPAGTCSAAFPFGTQLALTAIADAGNVFTGWSGACTGAGPCSFTVDGGKSVTANFAAASNIDVAIAGSGSGSVHSVPAGIACATGNGAGCSAPFAGGSTVTLIPAASNADSVFGGWSGACTNATGDCVVVMNSAKTVTATFDAAPNARIMGETGPYATIQDAYAAAPAGAVIQARAIEFIENLLLNRVVAVTIKGGYDPDFTTNPGMTVIDGTLTIGAGSLVVESVTIK